MYLETSDAFFSLSKSHSGHHECLFGKSSNVLTINMIWANRTLNILLAFQTLAEGNSNALSSNKRLREPICGAGIAKKLSNFFPFQCWSCTFTTSRRAILFILLKEVGNFLAA